MQKAEATRRVTLSIRVPAEHAAAVKDHAARLAEATGVPVSPSAAGAAILEAGLVALGLAPRTATKKGAKRTARKP